MMGDWCWLSSEQERERERVRSNKGNESVKLVCLWKVGNWTSLNEMVEEEPPEVKEVNE